MTSLSSVRGPKYGIAIILDGVFSHTGSDSVYFNKDGSYPSLGAYQSVDSPYYCVQVPQAPNDYECWWGVDTLPNVNELTFLSRVYQHRRRQRQNTGFVWCQGMALDVADELPDEFIETLRRHQGRRPHSVLIGEVGKMHPTKRL